MSLLPHCYDNINWTSAAPPAADVDGEYHKRAKLSLPLDAKTFMFDAVETNLTYGHFEVSATAPAGSTEAIVEVEASYNSPQAFANMTTCRIRRHSREGHTWGLGIFVSEIAHQEHERPLRKPHRDLGAKERFALYTCMFTYASLCLGQDRPGWVG